MEVGILGISLGTRHVGFAVVEHKELIDSRVFTFKGAWSEKKKRAILKKVRGYIDAHTIKNVAIKTYSARRAGPELYGLLWGVYDIVAERNLGLNKFDIEEIKSYFIADGNGNKAEMCKAVSSLYPELSRSAQLVASNKKSYHEREFEAVGMAHIVMKENRL